MNNYYIPGIGGTGAKNIEALTHLSAAGMIPDGELYVLFVDPDKANGNLERAQITLQQYIDCEQNLNLGNIDLFKTTIVRAKPDVWSPFEDEPQPRLDNFFRYNVLKSRKPEAAHLLDVLYSTAEKETTLEQGFRGHPSVGAAVLAKAIQLAEVEPWQTFRNRVALDGRSGTGARVFLFSSIFGGTGASGFPTIARLIRNELKEVIGEEHVKLGGALMLPYFCFTPDTDVDELRASSENFLMNTQVALKYYYEKGKTKIHDAVYLLGDEYLSPVDFCIGSRGQRNEPHFIELYGVLASIHFFKEPDPHGYYMLARHQENRIDWEDLPDGNGGNTIKQKIRQLTRFAFAYLGVYLPALDEVRRHGRSYRFPWYVNFFERENISINADSTQTLLRQVKDYCESFLLWLANIQTSAKGESVNLINYTAFAEQSGSKIRLRDLADFRLSSFDNLILPEGRERPRAISRLWERMCGAKVRDKDADGVGRFIHALYRECG